MERESIDTEKLKDLSLNILLVVTLLLGAFYVLKPETSKTAQTPFNSRYSLTSLQPLSLKQLPQYEEAQSIDSALPNQGQNSADSAATSTLITSSPVIRSSASQPTASPKQTVLKAAAPLQKYFYR